MHAQRSPWPVAALLLLAVPACLPWRGRLPWAACLLGFLVCDWRAQQALAARWPAQRQGEALWLQGHIASLPERHAGRGGLAIWRFAFIPEDALAPPRVRVGWYETQAEPRAGECWRLRLALRTPRGSLNPGGFDYEAWLQRDGIAATATVRQAERCDGRQGPPWLFWREDLRDALHRWLPGHPAAAMIDALVLGDDSGLTDAQWDTLRRTGTSHLIAISGFNVALVAGIGFWLGRAAWSGSRRLCLVWPAQKAGMALAAVFAVAYALLAGWEAPVERAALMAVALLGAALRDRFGEPSRVLAWVWLLLVLRDPFCVLSPGLWLSFAAVAAIFYAVRGTLASAPPWREALQVQLMLSVMLLPLGLYFFQGTSWVAPLVNLVAVPVTAVLTGLLLLAVVLAGAWPAVGTVMLGLCASAVQRLFEGLQFLVAQAAGGWWPAHCSLPALLLALAGGLLLFAPRGLPLRPLGLLCFLPFLWPPQPQLDEGYRLAILDVGQGLSVVVTTQHHVLLFDAGPAFDDGFDAGESVVVPYLLQRGLRRIDRLLVSHGDNDHAGGVAAVRRLLPIGDAIGAGTGTACTAGQRWQWDGVDFEILHPAAAQPWSDNDASCVLRVSGGFTTLLPGDIERPAEAALLAGHPADLHADVLLAPHHGSGSSSTAAFVAAVAPQVVVYSAGWHNRFRHPRPDVVARYFGCGGAAPLQRGTADSGAIEITRQTSGELRLRRWRAEHAHWWNAPAETAPESTPYWQLDALPEIAARCGGSGLPSALHAQR